jgi:hypothetical protein
MSIEAANTIKRAMRFNRDRIFNTIITNGRGNVSNEILNAYHCIYGYNDDVDNCLATMGCDLMLFDYWSVPSIQTPAIMDILNSKPDNQTSKKTMRLIYQTKIYQYDSEWDECRLEFQRNISHGLHSYVLDANIHAWSMP